MKRKSLYWSLVNEKRVSKAVAGITHISESPTLGPKTKVFSGDVDYYPFGMQMPGRHWEADSTDGYRFGFNGMEKDNSLKGPGNSYNFGARIYDSRLGIWLSVDPKFKKFPQFSPYIYSINNPVYFIDSEGEAPRQAGKILDVNLTTWRAFKTSNNSYNFFKSINDKDLYDLGDEAMAKTIYTTLGPQMIRGIGYFIGIAKSAKMKLLQSTLENLGWGSEYEAGEKFVAASQSNTYHMMQITANKKDEIFLYERKIENITKKRGIKDGFEAEVTEVKKYKIDENAEKKLQFKKKIEIIRNEYYIDCPCETEFKYKVTKYKNVEGELIKQNITIYPARPRNNNTNKE